MQNNDVDEMAGIYWKLEDIRNSGLSAEILDSIITKKELEQMSNEVIKRLEQEEIRELIPLTELIEQRPFLPRENPFIKDKFPRSLTVIEKGDAYYYLKVLLMKALTEIALTNIRLTDSELIDIDNVINSIVDNASKEVIKRNLLYLLSTVKNFNRSTPTIINRFLRNFDKPDVDKLIAFNDKYQFFKRKSKFMDTFEYSRQQHFKDERKKYRKQLLKRKEQEEAYKSYEPEWI